ncbi:hypothetical protein LIER_00072 [Lithospermum erythrorhizon]|uniref:glutathione transferase n=1 Tax=Lithospermum erythrorhizon TaxID=34254 RepID=A0AAV3NG47_LITER
MAIISTWMEVESQKFSDVASKLSHELVMGPASRKPINDDVVRENEKKLGKILDVYEVKLKESKLRLSPWRTEILVRVAWEKVVELQAPFLASMGANN